MANKLSEFNIPTLRGGLNNSDPPLSIAPDQCVTATNVEFLRSMLGERRRGTSAVTLPASLSGKERISFLFRHVPGTDNTEAELWAFGFTNGGASQFARKTSSWADISISDTVNISGFAPYQMCAASLHGKMFLALDTNVDRLHVWDGTTLRRTGLAEPAAPTGANQGSGTLAGRRYYRVRYTVQSGGTTLRRSEPSDALTFDPNGTSSAVRITKPASISESETHWELEASIDNANFFVIATTVVGTTTVDDTVDYTLGYAYSGYELSEDVGDYSLQWSARYLVVDEDRLLWGGSWETSSQSSVVAWSPVGQADGSGNDERWEADTDPFVNLDGLEGGPLTGLSTAISGEIWATKFNRIYKLVRSGIRSRAYDTICMSKARGALHGSLVPAVDQNGKPCLYALDPAIGPIRIGQGGIVQCGADIRTTWESIHLDATQVTCTGIFYPATRQVIWNIATGSSNIPTLALVLQTNQQRESEEGLRRGWSVFDGDRTRGLTMALFSTNIEANTVRNRTLVPFIGLEGLGLLHMCDTGDTDNGTTYAAQIRTKPFTLRSLMQQFGVKSALLLAKAVTGAKVTVSVIRNFGLETTSIVEDVELDAEGNETQVMKLLDSLVGSELRVAQFDFSDTSPAGTRFELNGLSLVESAEQQDA